MAIAGLESREYGRMNPSRWPRGALYPQKLALTSPDKRRSLGRYSSLADSGHGVYFSFEFMITIDRLCALVVRVSGYRSKGPGSIPGATRFFCEVVGLQRGSLSLVSTIEEQLERKSSASGLESREYGRRDPLRWPRDTSNRKS
jgi:hypothetical protein